MIIYISIKRFTLLSLIKVYTSFLQIKSYLKGNQQMVKVISNCKINQ